MKLVMEIVPHTGEERTSFCMFECYPVRIGRGFKSDVILPDPYVEAAHAYIDYRPENGTWVVADTGSTNGTCLNGHRLGRGETVVRSGDVLKVGRTELRVFSPHHPVAEAVREQESHPVFRWIERPVSAWVAFGLALLLVQCWSYLELWTDERGLAAAATAAGTVGIVAVWSLVWAAASRLILHKSNFRRHVTIISLYLTGSVGVWYVQSYVNFLTNENWISAAVQYAVNFGVLFVLLYATLRFTTRMEPARAKHASALFSGGVVCGALLLTVMGSSQFNPQPMYAASMEPYFSALAPVDRAEEFMQDNKELFASDVLSVKP